MLRAKLISLMLLCACWGCHSNRLLGQKNEVNCNPIDLSYRFRIEEPSAREAADPTIVNFKGIYYLFASKSGGYWYSDDLKKWTFVKTDAIPTEEYAPTAIAIQDTLYFLASSNQLYKSSDPKSGIWKPLENTLPFGVVDPCLFMDNNRLYLYWGCSNKEPLYGVELDVKNQFQPIGKPEALVFANPKENGWEVSGDDNTDASPPWIEGAWVTKYNNRYYLQYAAPGTQFKSYADGVYIADSPLGSYKLAKHNPFAYKPAGFISGAGHGSTFKDKYGNYWHAGTVTISVKHMFERRLAIYPVFFDKDNEMYACTRFGDYPFIFPDKKIDSFEDMFSGWMLLSYNKKVTVSSAQKDHLPVNMTDEDIRTYWAAETGSSTEWACINLGEMYTVYGLQVNFAEDDTQLYGGAENPGFRYTIEASNDQKNWKLLVDKSSNVTDNSHEFIPLNKSVNYQYIRINNHGVASGNFALSDLRVFGLGKGKKPGKIKQMQALRDTTNNRSVKLSWQKSQGAKGYNITYGSAPDKLYQNYMVYGDTSLTINSLSINRHYYFKIEAFNENGITKNNRLLESKKNSY